jgi:rhodanese-related sulfurtransferase
MNGTISRDEIQTKIHRGDSFQLVEALPEETFREHHLPGAVNLPPSQAKELAPQILPDKEADIVVYCANSTCTASEDAARELTSQGYRRVRRYVAGKQDWIDAGLPMASEIQAVGRPTP